MSKVVVLGGCGAVGSVVAGVLSKRKEFRSVVIADRRLPEAEALAARLGEKCSAREVDAGDAASVGRALRGADLVVNCVGPFYKTVRTILGAVLEAGLHYVDVCDDVDVTEELFAMSQEAERRGVTALIGMGSSPGVTNVLVALAAKTLLDETHSVDIFHAHGGEPIEGPGVIGHRFHCMNIDIPMFLDGSLKTVKYFEPDGIALRETFRFPVLDEEVLLYPYPHPEQVTLPRSFRLQRVTNKGTVLPARYYDLTRDLCAAGLSSQHPVEVGGVMVKPYDFAVAFILQQRERLLEETRFGQQRGCVSVIVKGLRRGEREEYRFHLASRSQALGEGTGIPAAMGAILVQQGKIAKRGVFPPEVGVEPADFLALVSEVMKLDPSRDGGQSFGGLIVERVDSAGVVTRLPF